MTPVVSLTLATAAFVGTHLLMSHPLRAALVARLGATGFLGLYALVSFVTLGWMIVAWRADIHSVPLWIAPLWWWPVASGLMLLASILLVGSLVRNPAFPHPGARVSRIGPAQGVFAITRHPMNVSFILWALVHISLSGNARNLVVAIGILILAWIGSLGQDRKKRDLIGAPWRDWEARTSFVPFLAIVQGKTSWRAAFPGWGVILGGALIWAAITSYHAPLVSPLGDLLG